MDPIVEEELALLARVSTVLESGTTAARPDEKVILRDLERLREQILSQREAKDAMSLAEQWHRQSALLRQIRTSAEAPSVDPRSPYFAHLRLEEAGEQRDLCLGRATRIESGIRIVDWRNAPISRVFYRYQQGDDYEEEFGGRTRSGTITARRTVRIRDGALERVEAPEGVFVAADGSAWERIALQRPRLAGGQGSALRAHGADDGNERRLGTDLQGTRRRVDKRLPEITSLIDTHQFELIAKPSGFVVIRGSAGSGKTTVALHRIAYLAYDDPRIDSEQTLFVVFSPALREYVRHVLPALGVDRVRIATFREWALEQRQRHFPELPAQGGGDAPAEVQRLMLHPGFADALERHVAESPGPRTARQALDDWASVRTRAALLWQCCEARAPGVFKRAEIERCVEWFRRRNEELFAWLEREPEVEATLEPEDDALLLRAWQLRVGPLRGRGNSVPLRYRHVAIDEVQDFAPLEVRLLVDCVDEGRCITLAGDTQQHVSAHSGFTSWSAFLAELGIAGASLETLRVNYRSTQEIMEFAQQLLGALREEDEPPNSPRSGPAVELFRFTDRGAGVAFLSDALRDLARAEPLASVAILTPSPEASALYFEGLSRSDLPSLRRVERQDFTFAPGVEITEIEQAKGLEFDYVVLADVTPDHYPDTPAARRLLHVGATRAVHQLWLTCVGTPSALVAGAWR